MCYVSNYFNHFQSDMFCICLPTSPVIPFHISCVVCIFWPFVQLLFIKVSCCLFILKIFSSKFFFFLYSSLSFFIEKTICIKILKRFILLGNLWNHDNQADFENIFHYIVITEGRPKCFYCSLFVRILVFYFFFKTKRLFFFFFSYLTIGTLNQCCCTVGTSLQSRGPL